MLFLTEIARGLRCQVFALGNQDETGRPNVPYADLRAVLARKCRRDLAQLDRLLAITKDLGPPFMLGKAARVADSELYELRTHRGARVFWLYGPRESVILLCGYRKQTVGMPRHEFARAEAWASALAQNDPKSLISVARPFRSVADRSTDAQPRTSAVRVHTRSSTSTHQLRI